MLRPWSLSSVCLAKHSLCCKGFSWSDRPSSWKSVLKLLTRSFCSIWHFCSYLTWHRALCLVLVAHQNPGIFTSSCRRRSCRGRSTSPYSFHCCRLPLPNFLSWDSKCLHRAGPLARPWPCSEGRFEIAGQIFCACAAPVSSLSCFPLGIRKIAI